jgi:chromosome segregation ATPase
MNRRLQLANDQLQQSQIAHRETKSSFSQCSSNIRATHNQIQNIRKEYLFLKDFYSKETQNWKIYFQTIENTFQKGIHLMN